MSEFNIEVQGGTAVKLPTAGKYCEKDIIVTAIGGGGGLEEIEQMIDESGVLDSTEGTATEKVEQLIDKASDEALWYQYTMEKTTTIGSWGGVKVERLPRMNFENVTNLYSVFSNMPNLKRVDMYIDAKNCTNFSGLFSGSASLEYVKGVNTSKATSVLDMFYKCTSLKTIEEPLDFSNLTRSMAIFGACTSLETIRIVKESIKYTFYVTQSSLLTAESIQSIAYGLAYVTTAQTLTLNKVFENDFVKLPAELRDLINTKGWTLAFA